MKAKNTFARQILAKNICAWGKNKVYFISSTEFFAIIKGGGKIISIDEPENGPYRYTAKFKKQLFVCSSLEKIKISTIIN